MVLWKLKSCPRCGGDVFIDKEQETWYAQCLQCSYLCDLFSTVKLNQHNPPYIFVTLASLVVFATLAGTGVRTQAGHITMTPNPKSTVYTLSLPVSRRRLLLMRSALGLLEATALSLICAIFMGIFLYGRATISDFTGPFLATLACGIWFYFVATLLSTFVNEEFYIWLYWIILALFGLLIFQDWMPPFLHILDVTAYPVGTVTAIPWLPIAIYLILGGLFLLLSIKIVEWQEN